MVRYFIDSSRRTGLLTEEQYQELVRKNLIEYADVENFKVSNAEFTLVLKAQRIGESFTKNYESMVIYYRYMGLPRKQTLEYNGFVTK